MKAEKIFDETFAARNFNTTPLTISGLEGDKYDYEVIFYHKTLSASSVGIDLQFNSDTGANYRNYYMRGYGSSKNGFTSDSTTSLQEIMYSSGTTGAAGLTKFTIKGDSTGERIIDLDKCLRLNGSTRAVYKDAKRWKNTANELTALGFSSANSVTIDVAITIYRTPKAANLDGWEYVGKLDWSAEATEKSFTGLKGDTDEEYRIEWDTDYPMNMTVNNDSSSTYKLQRIWNSNGSIACSGSSINAYYVGGAQAEVILKAKTGRKRLATAITSKTNNFQQDQLAGWYPNTVTEVTSLEITPTASTTGTAKLYRKKKQGTPTDTLPFRQIGKVDINGDFSAGHTFTGLKGDDYKLLKVEIAGVTNSASPSSIGIQFNGDTGNTTARQYLKGQVSTVAAAGSTVDRTYFAVMNNASLSNGSAYIYPKSGSERPNIGIYNYNENDIEINSNWWTNTAAEITSIKVFADNTNTVTGTLVLSALDALSLNTFLANTANLNGTSQYFNIPNSASLQISSSISYGGWVKCHSSHSGFGGMWGMYDGFANSNSSFGSTWWSNNDRPAFYVVDGTTGTQYNTVSTLNRDQWYFLLAVFDDAGNTFKIYVDGVEDFTTARTAGINASTTEPLKIGQDIDGYFEGSIGFSMVYNRAVTPAEVTELYNGGKPKCWDGMSAGLQSGCVLFKDSANWIGHSGQELDDQSGNGNNATNIGSTPFTETGLTVEC